MNISKTRIRVSFAALLVLCAGFVLRDNAVQAQVQIETVSNGTGQLTNVVGVGGACVVFNDQNGPDQWNVEEGETYTLTISGITECTGSPISFLVANSTLGNTCVQGVPLSSGTATFNFTMGPPACLTYPIRYYCDGSCSGADSFVVQDDDGDASHLRAATFGAGCTNPVEDRTCTAPTTTTTSTSTSSTTST